MLKTSEMAKTGEDVPSMTPRAVVKPSTCKHIASMSCSSFVVLDGKCGDTGGNAAEMRHFQHAVQGLAAYLHQESSARHSHVTGDRTGLMGGAQITMDVCEDGMPPEPMMRVKSHLFSV